jgi:hypothetical protein
MKKKPILYNNYYDANNVDKILENNGDGLEEILDTYKDNFDDGDQISMDINAPMSQDYD